MIENASESVFSLGKMFVIVAPSPPLFRKRSFPEDDCQSRSRHLPLASRHPRRRSILVVISLSHTELATSACAAAYVDRRLYEASRLTYWRRRRPNAKIVNLKTAKAFGLATQPTPLATSIHAISDWRSALRQSGAGDTLTASGVRPFCFGRQARRNRTSLRATLADALPSNALTDLAQPAEGDHFRHSERPHRSAHANTCKNVVSDNNIRPFACHSPLTWNLWEPYSAPMGPAHLPPRAPTLKS